MLSSIFLLNVLNFKCRRYVSIIRKTAARVIHPILMVRIIALAGHPNQLFSPRVRAVLL